MFYIDIQVGLHGKERCAASKILKSIIFLLTDFISRTYFVCISVNDLDVVDVETAREECKMYSRGKQLVKLALAKNKREQQGNICPCICPCLSLLMLRRDSREAL